MAVVWVIILAAYIPVIIFRGFVLASLWEWFAVPLGADDITTTHAIGIAVLVSLLVPHPAKPETDKDGDAVTRVLTQYFGFVFAILICWGVGAIVHGFM